MRARLVLFHASSVLSAAKKTLGSFKSDMVIPVEVVRLFAFLDEHYLLCLFIIKMAFYVSSFVSIHQNRIYGSLFWNNAWQKNYGLDEMIRFMTKDKT